MKTSKELKLIISKNFPRVPEENLKKLRSESATAEDIYVVIRLLEHHIEYQELLIAWLCRKLLDAGIPLAQATAAPAGGAAPPPNAEDGGASWVMAGLNPDDKSPSPSQQAAGGPADGGASWVMDGVEHDGPGGPPPAAPATPVGNGNGGGPAATPQILPNVQATGGAQPPEIAAMLAAQAAEQDRAKNKPKGA